MCALVYLPSPVDLFQYLMSKVGPWCNFETSLGKMLNIKGEMSEIFLNFGHQQVGWLSTASASSLRNPQSMASN